MTFYRQPLGQKRPPLVSSALRNAARGERCTLRLSVCNHDPETTVLAHLRFFGWAGIAQKPSDLLAVFACSACHDAIDRRIGGEGLWGFEDLLRALGETIERQRALGNITGQALTHPLPRTAPAGGGQPVVSRRQSTLRQGTPTAPDPPVTSPARAGIPRATDGERA